MRRWRVAVVVGSLAAGAGCAHVKAVETPGGSHAYATIGERASAISRAKVWTKTDVASMDIKAGPQRKGAIAPMAEVTCTYVQKELSGKSRKFLCELAPGDEVKVKYGERNAEVFGEVAASRLFWALGFGADAWYPVSVVCLGCGPDPFKERARFDGETRFPYASIERKLPGKVLETKEDEGWTWKELDLVDADKGGATRTERDALVLLAVMLQHTDSKSQQQRLICTGDEKASGCPEPLMYAHDIGLTFGNATLFNRQPASSVNFNNWTHEKVWKDAKTCHANISKSWTGSLRGPLISEGGRKFLSDLLNQLTDAQLTDLFTVARFEQYSRVKVEDWVAAFKTKRREIASVTCPS